MDILSALFGLVIFCIFALVQITRFCHRRYSEEGYAFVGKMLLVLLIIGAVLYQPAYDYWLTSRVESLHIALRLNRAEEAMVLINSGIPINKKGERGDYAIHAAVSSGNKDLVKEIISRGAKLENWGMHKYTPLIKAASRGDIDMVRMLLEAGADVNGQSDFKATALLRAAEAGHLPVVNLLLARGASLKLRDKNGRNAVMGATDKLRPEILQLFLNRKDVELKQDSMGWNLLHRVCFYGVMFRNKDKGALDELTKVIQILEGAGISWNELDDKGRTAAHVACENQQDKVLATIIAAGCPLEIIDKNGDTPLLHTIRKSRWQKVKMLYDLGANIAAETKDNFTAYELAKKQRAYDEILAILRPEGEVEVNEEQGSALGHSVSGPSMR